MFELVFHVVLALQYLLEGVWRNGRSKQPNCEHHIRGERYHNEHRAARTQASVKRVASLNFNTNGHPEAVDRIDQRLKIHFILNSNADRR